MSQPSFIYKNHGVFVQPNGTHFSAVAYFNGQPVKGSFASTEQEAVNKIMAKIDGVSNERLLANLKQRIKK